jgi:hypothetical protein
MTYYKVKTFDFEGEIFWHGHIMKKKLNEEPYPLGGAEPSSARNLMEFWWKNAGRGLIDWIYGYSGSE